MTPALCIFTLFISVLVTALFFPSAFYMLCAVLTFITMLWITNLAIFSIVGAYYVRRDSKKDWHAKVEQVMDADPEAGDCTHIIILPNYRENERMLRETLENIGRSAMAPTRVRVVLAMEAREGEAAVEKSNRLIHQTQHLFADIFATFHPANLPGEVAGKSSNTQWAFREALRHYGPMFLSCDLSKVFLTVADADTLLHPQYLSALTYSALTMSAEERAWKIWQPPIFLMRNIFTVPAMTRASAHATLIFELSALANQWFFPAFAYSAYSMSLALASHPEVDGWDVDVIAEDHHMFCKCYFAALWELAHASKEHNGVDPFGGPIRIKPQLRLEPVYLPAVSYLVESSDGYWPSLVARFDQARRHSQGVVELGYVLLQYFRLASQTGIFNIPVTTHAAIMSIAVKMHTLHITSTAQCFAMIMGTFTAFLPMAYRWLRTGGIWMAIALLRDSAALKAQVFSQWGAMDFAQQALAAAVSQMSYVAFLYSFTCWLVIKDLIEGVYYKVPGAVGHAMTPVEEEAEEANQGSSSEEDDATGGAAGQQKPERPEPNLQKADSSDSWQMPSFVKGDMTFLQRLSLYVSIFTDTTGLGYIAITFYAMIPVLLAAWSLVRRGTDFDYIVAVKPE